MSDVNTILNDLDTRLKTTYNDAYTTAVKNNEKAIAKLVNFDESKFPNASAKDLERARRNYTMQVQRTTGIVNNIAKEIANSGKTAAQLIEGARLDVFGASYQGTLEAINKQIGFNVNYAVHDRNQLAAILSGENQPFTKVGAREVYVRTQRDIAGGYVRERAYGKLGEDKVIVQRLQNTLTQAVLNGESIPKIATRIKAVAETSRRQAVTIARTETTRVVNQGRMTGFTQARDQHGIQMKKRWISTPDARTRPDHLQLDGETAELDEPFSNGLMQPGDVNGPPEQVVNCRCVTVGVLAGFDEDVKLEGAKYEDLAQTLHDYEDKIRNKNVEHGYIIDLDGNFIWHGIGGRGQIEPPPELVKNNIFTHNHPSGTCAFSVGDVKSIIADNGHQMRAVTQDGRFVSLIRGASGWDKTLGEDMVKAVPSGATLRMKAERLATQKYGRNRTDSQVRGMVEDISNGWLRNNASNYGAVFSEGSI